MEYARKCNTCGKIYCYTDLDVHESNMNKVNAAANGIAAVAQIFGGTMLGAYAMSEREDKYSQRIRDFTKCPNCNSSNTIPLSPEQYIEEQKRIDTGTTLPARGVDINANATADSLLRRSHLFLEDSEWEMADAYCEKILDVEPENAYAYLGKLLAELKLKNLDELINYDGDFTTSKNYTKARRFADDSLTAELDALVAQSKYNKAVNLMNEAGNEEDFLKAARQFEEIGKFLDAEVKRTECLRRADLAKKGNIYKQAQEKLDSLAISAIEESAELFSSILGYKDADEQLEKCHERIADLKKAEAEAQKRSKKKSRILSIIIAVEAAAIAVVAIAIILATQVIKPANQYRDAEALLASGDYNGAIEAFESLGSYKDSSDRVNEAKEAQLAAAYANAESLFAVGDYDGAIEAFTALGGYRDSAQRAAEADNQQNAINFATAEALYEAGDYFGAINLFWSLESYSDATQRVASILTALNEKTIAAGSYHTVGLKSDGTVVAAGSNGYGQCNVSRWADIVSVSASWQHTVGLKTDGTVVAVGDNYDGRCNVSDWTDIVAISAGYHHTVGLKSDGTVVAVGDNDDGQCDVSGWTDIVLVSAGQRHTIGLKTDGTLVATGYNYYGQCDVYTWTDIVSASAGNFHTVGLKSDGTTVAVGYKINGQCRVSDWTDIVAISAGESHTVGLKSRSTLVAAGAKSYGHCNVSGWTHIVSVSAGWRHTVGLTSYGSVIAVGDNSYGQCDVGDWVGIKVPG